MITLGRLTISALVGASLVSGAGSLGAWAQGGNPPASTKESGATSGHGMTAVEQTSGQDHATAQEVIAKVREAATTLSKTGDLAQFNQKQGPWVWKDSYIFVEDCDKKVVAAHPFTPQQIGQDLGSIKNTSGRNIYPDPGALCDGAKTASGVWIEYRWTRQGEKEDSRKISYYLSAKGTPYVVAAGIYDDKATIAELSKLSAGK